MNAGKETGWWLAKNFEFSNNMANQIKTRWKE